MKKSFQREERLSRMILHIVMLKPKPGTTDEEIQVVLEHVKELQPKIPGLLEVRAGKNFENPDSQGYTHGFVMQFINEAHMKSYFVTPQPDHEAVGNELKRICSYVAFDIPY
jgi:hypothetical protein